MKLYKNRPESISKIKYMSSCKEIEDTQDMMSLGKSITGRARVPKIDAAKIDTMAKTRGSFRVPVVGMST